MKGLPSSPSERIGALRALRAKKVAEGAHAFVRANAAFFYERLPARACPEGPRIYICADCHSENIGAVASQSGKPEIELNDFDETVIGEPTHDLLRLSLALSFVGRSAGLGGLEMVRVTEQVLQGYGDALVRSTRRLQSPPDRFARLLGRAARETQGALFDRRVPRGRHGRRRFVLGERYWPLTRGERAQIEALVKSEPVVHLSATLLGGHVDHLALEDAAFRIAGTGSLGYFRAAALVRTGKKKGDARLRLLDIKEAIPSHAPRAKGTPRGEAERIVAGARALAPAVGAHMLAASLGARPVVVRDLMPQELKATLVDLERDELAVIARFLGSVVGRAHRRQLDASDARHWRREACDPRWLDRALPPLVGVHESAYLQHCVSFVR